MKLLCLSLVPLLLPTSLLALGLRLPDQDAEASSRGNAFAATADSPAAIYYNPAGITQLEGLNSSFGVYGIDLRVYDKPKNGGSEISSTNRIQAAPQSYYTYTPKNWPVSFGLGAYAPFGFGLEYPDYSQLRTFAIRGKVSYLAVNPVVAWKVCKGLSIAAGLTLDHATADLRRGIAVPGDEFKFRGNGDAIGYNIGLLWQPCQKFSFGLTYRSATSVTFDGHTDLTVAPFAALGNSTLVRFPEQPANATLPFPKEIVAGLSFRPAPDWNVEFDIDWTDWHTLKTVTIYQRASKLYLPFNWQPSFLYELGVTHKLPHEFRLSAGYLFSEESVPSDSFDPSIPDNNRHIFSVGLGQEVPRLHASWDIGYQFIYGPGRSISHGNLADGTYSFYSNAISLSFGYHF